MKDFDEKVLGPWLRGIGHPLLKANDVLNHYQIGLGQNAFDLAGKLGFEVISSKHLPSKVCGFIQMVDNTPYIHINRNYSYERQQFTIAHEIAHYYLNHFAEGDSSKEARDIQADLFAVATVVRTCETPDRLNKFWRENPEMMIYLYGGGVATLILLGISGLGKLLNWITPTQPTATTQQITYRPLHIALSSPNG